jgi:nucleotide-binding universal stress UspA family protein
MDHSLMASASRSLEELAAAIQKRSGVVLEPQFRMGAVLEVILEMSADFSLLVLGARGRHPLRDFAIGTTTQRLVRQTRKPILVVRRKVTAPYRHMLVAVDFFSSYSSNALAYGHAIASQGEIHLVHVYKALFEGKMQSAGVSEEIIQEYRHKARRQAEIEMRHFIESSGVDGNGLRRSIVYGSHVPSQLLRKIREIDADLVVVGKHGKSLVDTLLLGSVTLHLLTECPCDVLVAQ